MITIVITLLLLLLTASVNNAVDTGFWYGDTRPPSTHYETVPYVDMTVRLIRSIFDGPGKHLVSDPYNSGSELYIGLTINRRAFDTQFVQDLSTALGISVNRIYVIGVSKGKVHYTWESSSVIVQFAILERNVTSDLTLLEVIASLTNQIQDKSSAVYTANTNTTCDIDKAWGLVVQGWDISLKLLYSIEVIGGDAVVDNYLNQGGQGICDLPAAVNISMYCEFERFFEDDVSNALNVSYYRIQILFVKTFALDSVLVYFRINPPIPGSIEPNITTAIANLHLQVLNPYSTLYTGNVTVRVDSLWGVSNTLTSVRTQQATFTKKYYDYDSTRLLSSKRMSLLTAYDRCKMNRRCNWGELSLDQSTNDVRYYQRLFDRGELSSINLFLDFQDWRLGSRGFSWSGQIPPTERGKTTLNRARASTGVITGAHFWPFDFQSLGPDIPCFQLERNQGLVLDRILHQTQLDKQEAFVDDIRGRVDWWSNNLDLADMGPVYRSRKDVRQRSRFIRADFTRWWENEIEELKQLNSSMCVNEMCSLLFDTTLGTMVGAIDAVGVIKETDGGNEAAIFTFNSIYLGPEVMVTIVGQRPLVLISKTTAVINTTFHINPGTLGGFPGGGSVARYIDDALIDHPRSILICQLGDYCVENGSNDTFTNYTIVSNNINGPGSGNVRVNTFVISTSADDIDEVQYIQTSAQSGQTLAGGFVIHFKGFNTTIIPHDASALYLKTVLVENLNLISPSSVDISRDRQANEEIGVGLIEVTRSLQDDQQGFRWNITFSSAIGNIEEIKVTNYLQGLQANVVTGTVQDGNEIGGHYTLDFQGYTTAMIYSNETASGLKAKLLALPIVSSAYVERIDPFEPLCDDGLCFNGPHQSRGLVWTVYVTTNGSYDNTSPTSPTSPLSMTTANFSRFSANSFLTGINASVSISYEPTTSPNELVTKLNLNDPFSLAFGGAGASYGGKGGRGYSEIPTAATYNDDGMTELLGGSGGCMKGTSPFEINSVLGPVSGQGGPGGGAMEIIAANDIYIGSFGVIYARGGDAEQSAGGGGGGGSGGAIKFAAGGVVVNEGLLDIRGGDGGYGGSSDADRAGGGGGGGRIAINAQSIVLSNGKILKSGGTCGIAKLEVQDTVVVVNITVHSIMLSPLDDVSLVHLGILFVNNSIETKFVSGISVDQSLYTSNSSGNSSAKSAIISEINLEVTLDPKYNSSDFPFIQQLFNEKYDYNIAEVYFLNVTLGNYTVKEISTIESIPTECNNNGEDGIIYSQTKTTTSMYVRRTNGAEGTSRALFLSNRESTYTDSGSYREAPFSWNGPIIPIEASRPTRVTYYTRLDAVEGESKKANFGVLFSLLSRGEAGLNVSSVIGVFTGDKITHGSNFGSAVDEKVYLKRSVTLWDYPTFDRWYKVDIHINWDNHTYYIALDDTIMVSNSKFTGEDIDGLRLSVTRAVDVWFDEIYVGFDNTLGFTCPTTSRTGTETVAPEQRHWSLQEVAGGESSFTEYSKMTRHYSHLDVTGSVPFDGGGNIKTFQDIKNRFASGDYAITQGFLHAGALQYITGSLRSGKTPSGVSNTLVSEKGLWYSAKDGIGGAGDGRQYWYSEHNFVSDLSETLNGGVAACSSQDLLSWRFEGFVFHYTNLSDMVYGTKGPFYVERPKVKFNSITNEYVMWAVMDDAERSLAMTSIATSPYEDGPFLFRRSFYPDGNRTRDQVIYISDDGAPVLARTYYLTVEYLLPAAVMQPVWESVKNKQDGKTNFRVNYHRGVYDIGYDNYHDIFNQRWRGEDVQYEVVCINKIDPTKRRVVAAGNYTVAGTVCNDPEERKEVLGQGNPIVTTLFVSPANPNNSWWIQTSVPAVKAQPWANSYRDGYCGIRDLQESINVMDPALESFLPQSRNDCSNIVDNPVHVSVQDKLIGVQRVVTSRRAKFMAISRLTDDMLETTGYLSSYEGELNSGDLISMIIEMGQFGYSAGDQIRSTYTPPVRSEYETANDYATRFMQYIQNYNDRATYSLACVLDGICPVNYKDQIKVGQN